VLTALKTTEPANATTSNVNAAYHIKKRAMPVGNEVAQNLKDDAWT
jgi:hypothetical protein